MMRDDFQEKKRKQFVLMRSIMDFGMGIAILLAGIFFLFRGKWDMAFNERFPPNDIDLIFGGICLLYGGWRIYRGIKKDYFK